MILSDKQIIERLASEDLMITPLLNGREQIGSSSIDIRLGTEFRYIKTSKQTHIDLDKPIEIIEKQVNRYSEVVHIRPLESFILHPDDFVLASTFEYFVIPKDLSGRLEGRSTWGRAGLQVHSTAGFVDPGFEGSLTFELHNMGKLPLPLFPGIRIGQLSLHKMEGVNISYHTKKGSKYSGTTGTKASMFYTDYEFVKILNGRKNEQNRIDTEPD